MRRRHLAWLPVVDLTDWVAATVLLLAAAVPAALVVADSAGAGACVGVEPCRHPVV